MMVSRRSGSYTEAKNLSMSVAGARMATWLDTNIAHTHFLQAVLSRIVWSIARFGISHHPTTTNDVFTYFSDWEVLEDSIHYFHQSMEKNDFSAYASTYAKKF
jgi:hypothetical protein